MLKVLNFFEDVGGDLKVLKKLVCVCGWVVGCGCCWDGVLNVVNFGWVCWVGCDIVDLNGLNEFWVGVVGWFLNVLNFVKLFGCGGDLNWFGKNMLLKIK